MTRYLAFAAVLLLPLTAPRVGLAQKSATGSPQAQKTPTVGSLPKVGTFILNTYYVTDSLGNYVPKSVSDPEMPDDSQFVVRSGIKVLGRTNCIALTGPGHQDTTYISFAKNGDAFIINPQRQGKEWQPLPFSLKAGKVMKVAPRSDTGHVLGRGYAMLNAMSYRVLGWDTVSVQGKVYDCVKLQILNVMTFDQSKMTNAPEDAYKNATNYWFSPELGYFPRINFGWGGNYFLNQGVKEYRVPAAAQ